MRRSRQPTSIPRLVSLSSCLAFRRNRSQRRKKKKRERERRKKKNGATSVEFVRRRLVKISLQRSCERSKRDRERVLGLPEDPNLDLCFFCTRAIVARLFRKSRRVFGSIHGDQGRIPNTIARLRRKIIPSFVSLAAVRF